MTEIVYLTLSHFNSSTRNYFLKQAGYLSLLDYELSTDNKLFELTWTHNKQCFTVEPGRFENPDSTLYFSCNVPLSSLSERVKDYLYYRFLSTFKYTNFEEYYLNNVNDLPFVVVFVPYKFKRNFTSENNLHINLNSNGERVVSREQHIQSKVLSGFTFRLNTKTKNSYILVGPKNDQSINSDRYGVNGWKLIENSSPIFYRVSLGGFIVSKKYYNKLIDFGAKEN